MSDSLSVYAFFIGWGIILGGLWGLSKTTWGYVIAYYSLWSLVLLMAVSHSAEIASLVNLTGVTNTSPTQAQPTTDITGGVVLPQAALTQGVQAQSYTDTHFSALGL